jgi:hypothetical protein
MEVSRRKNAEQPNVRYTYFDQQVSFSMLNGGRESGFTTTVSVAARRTNFWPAQLSLHGPTA